jgi:hypothetical protein
MQPMRWVGLGEVEPKEKGNMRKMLWMVILGVALGAALSAQATFDRGRLAFRAGLDGYQETPATLSTSGTGVFVLHVNAAGDEAEFALTYSGLEGGAVSAAHIHLGRPATTGGVMVFLCGGAKPACPASGTVTGTLTASDVIGPATQGIAAGEFAEFLEALRNRAAYVNVHTTTYGGGEIRGNIH